MRRAARVDNNHAAIVRQLRQAGASVWDTSRFGQGAPDLVVSWGSRVYLVEVKSKDGTLTADEADWHAAWKGPVHIVRSIEEALAALNAIR